MHALAIVAAFGLAFGLGGAGMRRFERKAAADLAAQLHGGRAHVEVQAKVNGPAGALLGDLQSASIRASGFSTPGLPLFVEPERSQKGRIGELRLELTDFKLAGLRVERLEATIPECRYDFALALSQGQVRLSRSGEGTGYVRVNERDLEDWILRKFHEIKRVWVRVDKDRVWVEGYGEFLIMKTGFAVIADLVPEDGTRLALANAKVYFGWRRAEPETARVLLEALNPVVDLPKDLGLYDAIHVERIRLRDGAVEAWGRTRVPERPAAPQP